jgi:hypothetical protein
VFCAFFKRRPIDMAILFLPKSPLQNRISFVLNLGWLATSIHLALMPYPLAMGSRLLRGAIKLKSTVIPAQAGIYLQISPISLIGRWTPAFARVTGILIETAA